MVQRNMYLAIGRAVKQKHELGNIKKNMKQNTTKT